MVASVSRPFEGRMITFLHKLAQEDPDTVARLLDIIAQTYPVKAVRLAEHTGVPIPATGD